MRHNKKFNHLGRTHSHREALLANMTISLIMHKRIFTTLAKAKALRVYAEPLINRAKEDTTANRRLVPSRRARSSATLTEAAWLTVTTPSICFATLLTARNILSTRTVI